MHMQIPIRRFSENEVLHLSSEEVPLKEASGRVCTEKVVPYPPGIPLLLPGEVITQEILDALNAYYAENANILKSRSQEKDRIFVVKMNPALE
jgi:arginine/lysine/ornithine decarboxylase